jgi:hypothetical protein
VSARGLPAAVLLAAALLASARPSSAQDGGSGGPAAGEPAPADPVGEARKLHAEGKELFRKAGDTDLGRDERKKLRQESYRKLVRARKLLDDWLEAHPADAENLDELYADIATTLFWLRKEGGVGEFEAGGAKPTQPTPEKPAPEAPGAPEAPKPPTAAEDLEKIRSYEALHPGDVPGLHERYSKFLAEHPDPEAPEYASAIAKVEELGGRLKDVYRKLRDEDPDSLADSDPAEIERLVDQLVPDLKNGDPAVRRRAARFLGGTGSGRAGPALVDALYAESDPETLESVKDALAKIGGRRVCQRLARDKPLSGRDDLIVDVLLRTVKRGGVSARIAGETLAPYVSGYPEDRRTEFADTLAGAGKDGALGLSLILDQVQMERRAEFIEKVGKGGDPRAAGNLARFLVVNPQGMRRTQMQAARAAILALGKPAVRHLLAALDDPGCQVWTAEVLREITGVKLKDDKRKTWERWFRENRSSLEPR